MENAGGRKLKRLRKVHADKQVHYRIGEAAQLDSSKEPNRDGGNADLGLRFDPDSQHLANKGDLGLCNGVFIDEHEENLRNEPSGDGSNVDSGQLFDLQEKGNFELLNEVSSEEQVRIVDSGFPEAKSPGNLSDWETPSEGFSDKQVKPSRLAAALDEASDSEMPNEGLFDKQVKLSRLAATLDETNDSELPGAKKRKSTDRKQPISKKAKSSHKQDREIKRATKKEVEEMHAESQRLLRETKEAAFQAAPVIDVPMSGLLSKLRMRKIQLGWKNVIKEESSAKLHPQVPDDEEDDVTEAIQRPGSPQSPVAMEDIEQCTKTHVSASEDNEVFPREDILETTTHKEPLIKCSNTYRKPLEDTQDLFTDSQTCGFLEPSSNHEDPPVKCSNTFRKPLEDTEDLFADSQPSGLPDTTNNHEDLLSDDSQRSLHLDDLNEDDSLEVDEPADVEAFPTKDPITALIDEEAEVEDNELLVKESDDEEDDSTELLDIIDRTDAEETVCDTKRAELHRQWLEQQDQDQFESILSRIQGNRKPRALEGMVGSLPTVLGVDDTVADTENRKARERSFKCQHERDALEDQNTNINSFLEQQKIEEIHESSDDEETERNILKQRLLEAAEEQEFFMSPAEDESSRGLLEIIKKANVPSNPKSKRVPETRASSFRKSKSIFLNRTSTSSSFKQTICTNSKSFIFGRDDSNSNSRGIHEISNCSGKENAVPTKASEQSCKSGPSLFSILKQQAAEIHQSKSAERVVMADKISIFAKFSKRRT